MFIKQYLISVRLLLLFLSLMLYAPLVTACNGCLQTLELYSSIGDTYRFLPHIFFYVNMLILDTPILAKSGLHAACIQALGFTTHD